jgi:hypothetical protein
MAPNTSGFRKTTIVFPQANKWLVRQVSEECAEVSEEMNLSKLSVFRRLVRWVFRILLPPFRSNNIRHERVSAEEREAAMEAAERAIEREGL